MMGELDPRMTFDSLVVGPGNRLASAAARRAADSPAASYNPLFLYSASGLGKSHILTAMAHHSERLNPDATVLYTSLERFIDELGAATEKGEQDAMRDRYRGLDIFLLDDVQFLAGQPEAQEMLLRTLDSLNASSSQIVLASDRPPAEIDGLDSRLLSRFSGGLMVDIAPPDYESRAAIVKRKLSEREATLAPAVIEALARLDFRNVRELQGGLNRLLAVQDLEEREVSAADVPRLVDVPSPAPTTLTSNVTAAVDSPEEPWQRLVREAAEAAEREGFSAARLRRVIDGETEPSNVGQIVGNFTAVLEELRQIKADLDLVGNPWPEAARGVLTDPERVDEARALLASARERVRDFPPIPEEVDLETLSDKYPMLAVRAATQLIGDEPPEYNPLFVYSPDGWGARGLLEAAGASFLKVKPTARAALISATEFAEEFINALSEGVAGAWRERWWTVELLLVHDTQGLAETERAQDEFFHLFEAVKRRGARIMIAADRPPSQIQNVDDRLRSRFEGGLVVDVAVRGTPPRPAEEILAARRKRLGTLSTSLDTLDGGRETAADAVRPPGADGSGEEILDPSFQAQLKALEGGFDPILPVPTKDKPASLTNINIDASEFPSLLPSEADRRLLENMGLELKVTPPPGSATLTDEPVADNAPADASAPVTGDVGDAIAPAVRDDLTDQIASLFSVEPGGADAQDADPAAGAAASISSPSGPDAVARRRDGVAMEPSDAGGTATLTKPTVAAGKRSPAAAAAEPHGAGALADQAVADAEAADAEAAEAEAAEAVPAWAPSAECAVWEWPHLEDRIVSEGA